MIEARKNRVIEPVFAAINKIMLRRHFAGVHVSGLEHLGELDRSLPMVFYGNHSCWWDGLIEFFLSKEVLRVDQYLMMDEKQMAKYKFFRWIGAFSVNRENAREAYLSVQYAASLLRQPNRVLWIYPQGVMKPNDARPLRFYAGTAHIVESLKRVQLIPIAHRYEFVMHQRPEAFVSIGPAEVVETVDSRERLIRRLETNLTRLLDELKHNVTSQQLEQFSTVLAGKRSTNEAYDRFKFVGVA